MTKKIIALSLVIYSNFCASQDTLFNKRLEDITVRSVQKKESNIAVINIVKNNVSVSDGVSIEYIKKTPDRNTADALKRINGVTIQNDKFVLVRGLADRYNSAMLNKTILPSTEPDRRSFSFDVIPSSMVDNIIIVKSAAANLPGDFSGGLVQITTKDVSNNFFSFSLGSGFGPISTFKKFTTVKAIEFPYEFPSTYKFRIGSVGDRRSYAKLLPKNSEKSFQSPINHNQSLSFGAKKKNWNVLFSSVNRETHSISYTDRLDYQSSTELAYKYIDTTYIKNQSINALLNVTYTGKYKYSLKTLFNNQIEQSYLNRSGENYDNVQNVLTNSSNTVTKTNLNSQFDGKIKTLDFNFGYNLMLRDQPDYRVNPLTKSLGIEETYQTAWRDTYRFWSIMNENGFNGSINKEFGYFKTGISYIKKIRNFQARIFRYESSDLLNEITNNTDKYDANFDLSTAYIMYDKQMGDWKLNSGIRTEYNTFKVNTSDFSGEKVQVNRKYVDLLPSINLSRTVNKTKQRLSISKTLARPEFREVSNFAYYDFVRNAQLLGNPKLEKTSVYNVDAKWELYPKSGENFSIGVFGKQFIKPIEQVVADGSVPSNLLLTYSNPNRAFLYGIELEIRKKLNAWIDVYANGSLIKSEVNVNNNKRRLQGQSNYIANSGINLHKNNHSINLTYNRIGNRISAVGFQGYPDILENSRDIIDVSYLYKFKKGEIKLAVSDVLAQPSIYYQKPNRNLIKTNNEQGLSLTLNFNL